MVFPGLVSVTFRDLTPAKILELCLDAGVVGIEWGGDIHVPCTDLENARWVGQVTRDAGLSVAAYGSYYVLGESAEVDFRYVIDAATALGAPVIRVWAGTKGSGEATVGYWEKVKEDLLRISEMAKRQNLQIAIEYHENTLTDDPHAALRLVEDALDNVSLYWQTTNRRPWAYSLDTLRTLNHKISNVHVFNWVFEGEGVARRPLAEASTEWAHYLDRIDSDPRKTRFALLEFVAADSPDQFMQDAATLNHLLAERESEALRPVTRRG